MQGTLYHIFLYNMLYFYVEVVRDLLIIWVILSTNLILCSLIVNRSRVRINDKRIISDQLTVDCLYYIIIFSAYYITHNII